MSKKIYFLSVFNPYRGGIAQFSDELVLALRKITSVNAYNFKRQYPSLLFPGKTQVTQTHREGVNAEATLDSINPFSFIKTRNILRNDDSEVVITSYWMSFFGPCLGYALKGLKKKRIALLHNVVPHEGRFFDKLFTKYYLKQNDEFVVLSETVKNQLLSFIPDAKVHELFHPVYQQFGEKLPKEKAKENLAIDANQKTVLFFGFVRAYKGLDLLIDAIADLGEGYTLIIAGESYEDYSKYASQIKSKGDSFKCVQAIRYIEDSEVSQFFSAADVCALPYKSATQSGIASVAKSFELPMVSTNVGELGNEFIDGETGVLAKEVSSHSFSEALKTCFDQLDLFKSNLAAQNSSASFDSFAKKLMEKI